MRSLQWGLGVVALSGAVLSAAACADGESIEGGGGEGGVVNVSTGVNGTGGSSSSSTSASSSSTSASTTSASSTSASSTSASSTSSGQPVCDDPGQGEPQNDTRGGAHYLGAINDNDSNGSNFSGVIVNSADVDWYRYEGNDAFGFIVDPSRSFVGPNLRICKYIACKSGNTEFSCPSNTSPDTVDGIAGCCATGNVDIEITGLNCTGTTSENTNVYIRVDAPGNVDCLPYSVAYHY